MAFPTIDEIIDRARWLWTYFYGAALVAFVLFIVVMFGGWIVVEIRNLFR